MTIVIRDARPRDIPSIKKLIDRAHEMDTDSETFSSALLKRMQDKGISIVAEKNRKIIGCCFGTSSKNEKWADMLGLVVDELHRGKGIGRKLVDAFEEKAHKQGIRTIDLYVHHTRKELFKKWGFQAGETYIAFRKVLRKKATA